MGDAYRCAMLVTVPAKIPEQRTCCHYSMCEVVAVSGLIREAIVAKVRHLLLAIPLTITSGCVFFKYM